MRKAREQGFAGETLKFAQAMTGLAERQRTQEKVDADNKDRLWIVLQQRCGPTFLLFLKKQLSEDERHFFVDKMRAPKSLAKENE